MAYAILNSVPTAEWVATLLRKVHTHKIDKKHIRGHWNTYVHMYKSRFFLSKIKLMKKIKIKAYFKLSVTSYTKSLPTVKIFYTLAIKKIKATT